MDDTPDDREQLEERVEELETRFDALTNADEVTVERDGSKFSLGDLLNIGLTRRQATIALSALAAGAAFPHAIRAGIDTAAAQTTVGQVGTDQERVDVYGAAVQAQSLNNGGIVNDGDGTDRSVWVIANGASDPAGAGSEDIIFEEES